MERYLKRVCINSPRRFGNGLRAAVLAILMLGSSFDLTLAQPAAAASRDHVYLLRGAFNVFSLGLDEIANNLTRSGVPTTVANHLAWPQLADEAAAEYKSGHVKTIILVGHSYGALAVTSMAARLGQLGVPVKLAIGLDPSARESASGRVGRYINYFVPGGLGNVVDRGPHFTGILQNVDMSNNPSIGHFNIDKNSILQQTILREIRAAL